MIGPAIGGSVTQYLGWRWNLWILAILGSLILILIFFFLPETFTPSNLPKPNTTTSNSRRQKRFDPISPIFLLKYPNMSLTVIYLSIIYAIMYVQNTLVGPSFSSI